MKNGKESWNSIVNAGTETQRVSVGMMSNEEEQDICGLCGKPGADKIAHPMLWPGEKRSETGMVHSECESTECQRAHNEFYSKAGERGVWNFLRGIK